MGVEPAATPRRRGTAGACADRDDGWSVADGLGTAIAGFGGGSGTTTYGENIGVMASTKVYSTAAYWFASGFALSGSSGQECFG